MNQKQTAREQLRAHVDAHNATKRPFASLGEQLLAIREASRPGGPVDPRLLPLGAASGMNASTGSEGGFLLHKDFSSALIEKARCEAVLWPRVFDLPVTVGNGIEAPILDETSRVTGSRLGGVRMYRAAEADTVDSSKPKLGNLQLELEDLVGLFYATRRLTESVPAFETVIDRIFSQEVAFAVDNEILRGTGAGQSLGILSSGSLVTVAKESGQSADTVVTANLAKMLARCPAGLYPRAVWLAHSSVLPQVCALAETGPVYTPPDEGAPYGRIYTRPLLLVEQASVLGDLGDVVLAVLDEYVIASRPQELAESIHVRFLYTEQVFRWTLPIMGAPAWANSVTPFKGSDAISPFVALAERA